MSKTHQKNPFGGFLTDFSLHFGALKIWWVKEIFLQKKNSLLEIQSFWCVTTQKTILLKFGAVSALFW
jgi:hypothetical protein